MLYSGPIIILAQRVSPIWLPCVKTVRHGLHPMTPIIGQGHLFVFMEPTSPKGHDLQCDGRYAIHCSVSDTSGTSGEFFIQGQAHLIDDPELRALAVSLASYAPDERYILFEFDVERAGFDDLILQTDQRAGFGNGKYSRQRRRGKCMDLKSVSGIC